LPTDRRFTGQREEASLGFYDYGARQYDPALGRFLQADTLVPNPGNPQSLNRYAYTLNNPLRYTDPSGHYADKTHYDVTQDQELQIVANLNALAIDQDIRLPGDFDAEAIVQAIADSNRGVDTSSATKSTSLRNLIMEYDDTGRTAAEYWHFTSLTNAESRLQQAVQLQDAESLGQALHSYQDYWAHTRNGFTVPMGQAGIDRSNTLCPECVHLVPNENIRNDRASMLGHAGAFWPDKYTPADDYWNDANMREFDRNDTLMRRGTYYWMVLFLCTKYGIDPQIYWDTYGEVAPPKAR